MHFGASAVGADGRRRDAGDAAAHLPGAATKQMPPRRRAPAGWGPQARWRCYSLLTYRSGYARRSRLASATGRVRETTTNAMPGHSGGGGVTKKSARPVATRRADGGCGRSLRWSSSKMAKHRLPPPALISPHKPHLQTSPYLWNRVLRVCAKITWHFGISFSHHLRPLLNREILNVDPATPAVSLNRSRPNLVQI